jgi:hypothetical protein
VGEGGRPSQTPCVAAVGAAVGAGLDIAEMSYWVAKSGGRIVPMLAWVCGGEEDAVGGLVDISLGNTKRATGECIY